MPFLAFCVFIGPVVTGFEDAPHWAVLALGLPLVSKLDPRPLLGWPGVLLIAGVAWAALGLAWTPDPLGGALDLWHTVLLSLVVVAAAGIENPRRVMTALAYGIAVSVGVAVFQLAGYHPIATVNRPAGLFFNRDLFAEAAAPVFIWAALGKRWRSRSSLCHPAAHLRLASCVARRGGGLALQRRQAYAMERLRGYGRGADDHHRPRWQVRLNGHAVRGME